MAARRRQEERTEASVGAVLDAALALFSTQGFRATNMRDIAERAGLSVGNIYHHFPNKQAIYQRLIDRYWERLLDPELPLNQIYARGNFPDDLEEMAAAIEQVVADNAPHILLIYVDVIEFQGQHIRAFYEGMAKRFQGAYSERFEQRRAAGDFGPTDPMTAIMVASRWLFYFFTVEKCFGVPMHFGMTQEQATREFIHLLRHGLLRRDAALPAPAGGDAAQSEVAAKPTARGSRTRAGSQTQTGKSPRKASGPGGERP
jgi:AcrR family transcriptional regulator